MEPEKIRKALFNNAAFLGKFRREKAMERLLAENSRIAGVFLAEAVEEGHPEADTILGRLFQLRSDKFALTIAAAWNYWKQSRFTAVVRSVLRSDRLKRELLETLTHLPCGAENDSVVFMLWKLLDEEAIGDIIEKQKRRAPDLELDALFGLVRGDARRYLELDDPEYLIFVKLWHSATASQRSRIGTTVFESRNPHLIGAYDSVVGKEQNPLLILDVLKNAGDHDTLFKRLHGMPFTRVLELLDYWAHEDGRPQERLARECIELALAVYRELLALPVPYEAALPPGTRSLLAHWADRQFDEVLSGMVLAAEEPFHRAGALYVAAQQGMIPYEQLLGTARNGSWPEKLVARLLAPEIAPGREKEHVCWLTVADNPEARMMSIRMPGSMDDYHYFLDLLAEIECATDPELLRRRALLRIMTIMQRHFLRGVITVDDSDDAPEKSAVETEDALDVRW